MPVCSFSTRRPLFTICSSFLARPEIDRGYVGFSHPMAHRVLLKLFSFFQLRPVHSPYISVPSCAGYPRPAVGYESIWIEVYHPPQATGVCHGPGADRSHSRNEGGQKWQRYGFILGGHLNVTRIWAPSCHLSRHQSVIDHDGRTRSKHPHGSLSYTSEDRT